MFKKFLEKLGVKEFSELTEEEKQTYREWDEIISGRKLTDEEVKTFLGGEINEIQVKLINPNLSVREDLFLKMKLEFIMKLMTFLAKPELEKRALEKHINELNIKV